MHQLFSLRGGWKGPPSISKRVKKNMLLILFMSKKSSHRLTMPGLLFPNNNMKTIFLTQNSLWHSYCKREGLTTDPQFQKMYEQIFIPKQSLLFKVEWHSTILHLIVPCSPDLVETVLTTNFLQSGTVQGYPILKGMGTPTRPFSPPVKKILSRLP